MKFESSKIRAISTYFPTKTLSNVQLNEEFPEWSADKISEKTGIYNRHIADVDEFVSDLAIEAANKLFEDHNIDKKEIDFILLCTQSPDYFLPTTACIVQDKLGLSTDCGALDFNLGCSGFVYGLSLANGLILSGSATNVLMITSETYSKHINIKDKSNRTIFGDAAAATLVSLEGISSINDFIFGSDGSGAENLIVKNGGLKHFEKDGFDKFDEDNNFKYNDNNLYMNGEKIFKFTTQSVPQLVEKVLIKNNISFDEIDLFIFHQANKFMLDYIRRKLNIPVNKFYINLENVGNTVSSTIPIAIESALDEGKIKSGMNVLIAGFGVGYSYAATVLKF
jgi:3-oxoacyl-[acyl-carrier-protein] synthase-3